MPWRDPFSRSDLEIIAQKKLRAEEMAQASLGAGLMSIGKAFLKNLFEKKSHLHFDKMWAFASQPSSPLHPYYQAAQRHAGKMARDVDKKSGDHALHAAEWFVTKGDELKAALAGEAEGIKRKFPRSELEHGKLDCTKS